MNGELKFKTLKKLQSKLLKTAFRYCRLVKAIENMVRN